jgi:hypothetical protein
MMHFPDGMPDDLKEMLQKAMGHKCGNDPCQKGTCDCQQVAKVQGEELLLLKTNIAKSDEGQREVDLMEARAERMNAENKERWAQFWEAVYKKYGLVSSRNYHWVADGRIMLRKGDH